MNELSRRIGKFSSPEALLKAYESLQGEFTKRCQRLKDCEKENEVLKADAACANKRAEIAKDALKDEDFVAQFVAGDEGIRSKIVMDYLEKVYCEGVPVVMGAKTGGAALTPVKAPKSLSEAKVLADVMLRG